MTYDDLIARHEIKAWLGILPGLGCLASNEHKLDDWQPHVEVAGPGFKHSMNISPGQKNIIRSVMKVNKKGE